MVRKSISQNHKAKQKIFFNNKVIILCCEKVFFFNYFSIFAILILAFFLTIEILTEI